MKGWGHLFGIALCCFVLGSCSQRSSQTPPTDPHKEGEFKRDQGRFANADEVPKVDVLSYALSGRFDWEANKLIAQVVIQLKPLVAEKTISLHSLVSVKSVKDSAGAGLTYTEANGRLNIDLKETATVGKEMLLAISYEASAGEPRGLNAVAGRKGDPVQSRVYYVTSEPEGAATWMPCHNVPSDRALFSAEFTFPPNEVLIANGDLRTNAVTAEGRRMRYATKYTIPTYLMAFAVGEMEATTQMHGNLPVSFWHRKGLKGDWGGMVLETIRTIKHYESLMVPYPFEKYAVVALPDFPSGGIEHAGITFQAENRSSQAALSPDVGLMAHELGHQWFGDLVTVETWDDLWIKEGMATLLSEEGTRVYQDYNKSGRLFGINGGVAEGDAIRDPNLPPDKKYTSGPYGRASWLLTQIRAEAGEEKFWGVLKTVLTEHAFGFIGTDAFLAYFKDVVSSDFLAKVKKAVSAKALPELKGVADGAGTKISLEDKDGALVRPITIGWISATGALKTEAWEAGQSKTLVRDPEALFMLDVRDEHPIWSLKKDDGAKYGFLKVMVPQSASDKKAFEHYTASQQIFALHDSRLWKMEPADLVWLLDHAYSEDVKFEAIRTACELATSTQGWKGVISAALTNPPLYGMENRPTKSGYAACSKIVGTEFMGQTAATVQNSPQNLPVTEPTVLFLAHLDRPATEAFTLWKTLLEKGQNIRVRLMGLSALAKHLDGSNSYSHPDAPTKTQWKKYLTDFAKTTEVTEILNPLNALIKDVKEEEE